MVIERMNTPTAKAMLNANDLLYSDVSLGDGKIFFGCRSGKHWLGLVGLECHGDSALLRSLLVEQRARKRGLGGQLVGYCEKFCKDQRISTLYLLTETAQPFFSKLGYVTACREHAPSAINATRQASSLCSKEAVMMLKHIVSQ